MPRVICSKCFLGFDNRDHLRTHASFCMSEKKRKIPATPTAESPLVKLQRVGASPEGTFMNKENSHEDTMQDIAVCNNTDLPALKNQVNHSETEASDESCGSHSDSSCGEDGDDKNHADVDGFRPDRPGIVPVEHPKVCAYCEIS